MMRVKLLDRVENMDIRKNTKEGYNRTNFTAKMEMNWHVVRLKDGIWSLKIIHCESETDKGRRDK